MTIRGAVAGREGVGLIEDEVCFLSEIGQADEVDDCCRPFFKILTLVKPDVCGSRLVLEFHGDDPACSGKEEDAIASCRRKWRSRARIRMRRAMPQAGMP